jgi:putative spermidine/putrescine transport system permease protein
MRGRKLFAVLILSLPGFTALALFFVLPLGAVLAEPFYDRGEAFLKLVSDSLFWKGLAGSAMLAFTAGAVSVLCGIPVAFSLSRMRPSLKTAAMFCISLPLTFSGLVVAYGFILIFGRSGLVTHLLAYAGVNPEWMAGVAYSPVGLALAYCYFLIPRVALLLLPVVNNFDRNLLAAAESLGAGKIRAWFEIVLPELRPTIVFSFFLVAAIAFGAYGTALALVGSQINILPLLLYSRISDTGTDFQQATAISLVLMAVCSLMMGVAETTAMRRERFKTSLK